MSRYSQQREAKRQERRGRPRSAEPVEQTRLRIEAAEVCNQRRRQRLARREADAHWRKYRQDHRDYLAQWRKLSRAEKRQQRASYEAAMAQWREGKMARQVVQAERQAEDVAWGQARQALHTRRQQLDPTSLPAVQVWLAILVIVDNCTRRCLGLPLFTAGAHVTSEMVVAALRQLLPAELQFLISDNGPQFTAEAFAALTRSANFIHVRIAPHRPCTNGIAERFVQTLKGWLADRTWATPEELEHLLVEFLAFYNDRPHQGAELDGLSPNEYARRLARRSPTCSTC
jgi:transposase InsO family protein